MGDDISPPWNNASSILAKRLVECLSPQLKCALATVRPKENLTGLPVSKTIFVSNGGSHALLAAKLALAVRKSSVDVVHLVGTNGLVFAPLCKSLGEGKRIVRHVFTSYDRNDRLISPARIVVNTFCIDGYAFTTPWIGRWGQQRSPRTRRFLLRPPIDCSLYKPARGVLQSRLATKDSRDLSILYMGPLLSSRFPAVHVLGAIKKLVKRGVDAGLLVLTSSSRTTQEQADRVDVLARNMNIDGRVSVRRVDLTEKERVDAYNSTDVVIFPFVGPEPEKLADPPFGMLEAMACGRIVLGTKVLSIPEVIQDGVSGFLALRATGEDLEEGLYRAWTSLKSNEVGENARLKIVQDFGYDRVRREAMWVYESLLAQ